MECPNCHRDNPNRARTCLYCGAALPRRRRRGVGGGGILAALIVCALVSTVGIRPLQRPEAWPGAAYEEDLRMENPERGAQEQRKDSPLGSAGYLRGDVILVSLYISDDVSEWTAERQANAQSYLSVACSYLEEQAARTGRATVTVPFDRQALADYLCVDRSALSRTIGALQREGVLTVRRDRFTLNF